MARVNCRASKSIKTVAIVMPPLGSALTLDAPGLLWGFPRPAKNGRRSKPNAFRASQPARILDNGRASGSGPEATATVVSSSRRDCAFSPIKRRVAENALIPVAIRDEWRVPFQYEVAPECVPECAPRKQATARRAHHPLRTGHQTRRDGIRANPGAFRRPIGRKSL